MAVALNIAETSQPLPWILVGRFEHTFHIQDFPYQLGRSSMLASLTTSLHWQDQTLQWYFAVILCKDGLINLGYKLIGKDPIKSSPNVEFWVVCTTFLKGLDGQKLVHVDTLSGQTLPSFRNKPDWSTVWNASIDPNGPHVSPKTRPLQHYLSKGAVTLDITFHLVVWQSVADIDSYMPTFDVRSLNLPEELQAEVVDVCLVTKQGIIQAHSRKICGEFPGLLIDPGNAPLRNGFIWAVINEPFNLLVKLVKIIYDCFYHGVEWDILELLVAAKRLNMKELVQKIVQWHKNYRLPHQLKN